MSDYYLETDKRILKSLQYACISNEKEHNCEKTCQSATHPRSYRCGVRYISRKYGISLLRYLQNG